MLEDFRLGQGNAVQCVHTSQIYTDGPTALLAIINRVVYFLSFFFGNWLLKFYYYFIRWLQKSTAGVMSQQAAKYSKAADEVLFDAVGSARIVTLNRPKALNALNLNMVERMLSSMKVG